MSAHEPALVARAIHDVTCPEGPDCRDRLLHSAAQPLAHTGVLAQFLDRLAELESRAPIPLVDLAGSDAATADAPPEASDWRTRGCTIAGRSVGELCGEPVHGAVLVHTYALPLSDGIRTAPLPRGVLVCRRHFGGLTGAPPFPPDLDAGRAGGCACAPSGGDGVQCPDANGQLACDDDPAPVPPEPPNPDLEETP